MLHYSCDLCGKDISENRDRRFVVKIEVYEEHSALELTDDDLDRDQLEEIGQLLEEEAIDELVCEPLSPKKMRYDLCVKCKKKFLYDPLNRESTKLDFSSN